MLLKGDKDIPGGVLLSVVGPGGQTGMALLAEARVKERSTASDLCFPKKYHPRLLIHQGNVGLPFPLGEHIQLISTVALPPNLHASPLLPASPKTNISSRCLALGILIETIYFPALGSSVSLAAVFVHSASAAQGASPLAPRSTIPDTPAALAPPESRLLFQGPPLLL